MIVILKNSLGGKKQKLKQDKVAKLSVYRRRFACTRRAKAEAQMARRPINGAPWRHELETTDLSGKTTPAWQW